MQTTRQLVNSLTRQLAKHSTCQLNQNGMGSKTIQLVLVFKTYHLALQNLSFRKQKQVVLQQ